MSRVVPTGASPEPMLIENVGPHRTVVTGTKEQLVSAGVCTPTHFPEGRKRAARKFKPDGSGWKLEKIAGRRWRLTVWCSEQERHVRTEADTRRKSRTERLSRRPSTPQEFRERLIDFIEVWLTTLSERAAGASSNGDSGFALDSSGQRALSGLITRVYLLLNNAEIQFDPVRRTAGEATGESETVVAPRLRAPLHLAWRAQQVGAQAEAGQ